MLLFQLWCRLFTFDPAASLWPAPLRTHWLLTSASMWLACRPETHLHGDRHPATSHRCCYMATPSAVFFTDTGSGNPSKPRPPCSTVHSPEGVLFFTSRAQEIEPVPQDNIQHIFREQHSAKRSVTVGVLLGPVESRGGGGGSNPCRCSRYHNDCLQLARLSGTRRWEGCCPHHCHKLIIKLPGGLASLRYISSW